MLTTIQELEKQIDRFHQNIKDSNELMEILKSVASATKNQTESFEQKTKALQEELGKLPPELSDLFRIHLEAVMQEVHNEHQVYQVTVEKLMEHYTAKLADTEAQIAKVPEQLSRQLEATKMDQLYKYCQQMNKSLNLKMLLVFGGVAMAIVVSVISLIL